MARTRFVGSGREKEGGFLAVHKRDFEAHRTGGDWRHEADQIDMNPQLTNYPSPTVQGTLEKIASFLDGGLSSFISIGADSPTGFARGDINVGDPGIATLEDAFDAAFASTRLTQGGTILLKPGNFSVSSTIVVPEGVSIMGDLAGTYINNPATNAPIFRIERVDPSATPPGYYDIGNSPISGLENVQPVIVNRIFNLILSDNREGGGGDADNVAMTSSPMIQCDLGSNVEIEQVTFLGRTGDSGTNVTHRGIDYTSMANPGTPTILRVKNCYFDGVAAAIEFSGQEGVKDFIRVEGCRARTFPKGLGPEDHAFIGMNLCNAFILNNYHVANNADGFDTAAAFVILKSFNPSDSDIQVVMMGNSGGPVASNSSVRNLISDERAGTNTAYRGTVTGNSWGVKTNNDWYMTVGDGTTSLGDINGKDSIDIALLRSRQSNEGAFIIVNPGTYDVTETGDSDQRPKLIGNPRVTKPVLNINGSSTAGRQGHDGIHIGMELHNLTLTAVGAVQTLDMFVAATGDKRWRVSDCEFNNVTLNIEQSSDGTYTSAIIKNCEFNQTGAYPNTVSLVLSEATRYIEIYECYFHSTGYALYIGDQSSTPRFQRINIEKCRFEGVADPGDYSIEDDNPISSSYNYYMWIANGNRQSDVTIRDCMLRFVDDGSSSNNYEPIDTTKVNKLCRILCGTLTIDNSKSFGPYQTFDDSGTWAFPTWYIAATRGVQLLNSRFFGSLPVKITGMDSGLDNPHNVRTQFGDGAFLRVDGCEFSSYDQGITGTGFYAPAVLGVELEDYDGDSTLSNGMVNITNSSFYSTNDGISGAPTFSQHEMSAYTDSKYRNIGCVQIYAEGWAVHFNNNDVNVRYSSTGNTDANLEGQAAVVIDTIGSETSSTRTQNSVALINGNNILLRSTWNGGEIDHMATVVARTRFLTMTGNNVRWSSDNNGGGKRLLVTDVVASTVDAAVVTGNTFFIHGWTPNNHILQFDSGAGMFVDNVLDQPTEWLSSVPANDEWIIERNKGQKGLYQARYHSAGKLADDNEIYSSSVWSNVNYIRWGDIDDLNGSSGSLVINVDDGTTTNFYWRIPLFDILPSGVKITSVSVSGEKGPVGTWDNLVINLRVYRPDGSSSDDQIAIGAADIKTTSPDTATATLSTPEPVYNRPYVEVSVLMDAAAGLDPLLYLSSVSINYEW